MYAERAPRGYGYYDGDRPNLGTGGALSRDPWERERHPAMGAMGGHRGKGPLSYQRADDRIRDAVCEVLTDDDRVDATNIEVTVKSGEVTLSGTVEDRYQKRCAEDVVESVSGVKDIQNQIRVAGDRRMEPGDRPRHRVS
jgi:hypothetical protein